MFQALLTKGKDFFLHIFDIRMGEFRRVWLMQLNVFLLIQSLWMIKPVVNARFLSSVGIERLPLVFLLVAMTALAVATAYSRLLNSMPLGTIMKRTYVISILSLLTFGALIQFHLFKDWMIYLFYIGVALFGLITTSQFWLLANLVFSSLEAKRLFGIIGAGAIAGGISGGYITSVFAPRMDSTNLLFVAAGFLVAGMVITNKIWMTYVPAFNRAIQIRQTKTLHEYPLRLIRNSKHLSFLALIMGISVVVDKLVEFQFSSIASASIADPDKLTAFFGFWFSTANVISLGIQLLITQRVLGFIGVGRSLFVFPGALFAGAAAVLNTPVLWAGTTLKVIDISLKQSINKAATELLILPIPMAIKSQAKTFIDIFVDTTATGIGGILLIFIVNGFHLSVRAVCIMILGLIGLWIYFAMRVRKEYVLAFEEKMGVERFSVQKKQAPHSAASVVEGIRRTLKTGTTRQILFLLARIEEGKDARLMPDTIPLLAHDSPLVRQAALRCLYYHTDHTITDKIAPLLKDPDDEVRSRAFSCLLAHNRHNRVKYIEDYLQDADPAISGAALVGLATEARDNPVMQKLFTLEQRVKDKIEQTLHMDGPEKEAHQVMIARTIGYGKLETFYPLLKEYIRDSNPAVVKQAILSAGTSQDTDFLKLLLSFLPNKTTRSSARKAIAKYEPSEILPLLDEVSNDRTTKTELLIQLPALAEMMDTQQAIDFLFGLVQHRDPSAKLEALEALHTIKAKFPHLTISGKRLMPILMEEADLYRDTLAISYATQLSLKHQEENPAIRTAWKELTDMLERRLNASLERIFWVLGLTYPPGIMLPLYKDLRHTDSNVRMNSVELLDNILEPPLKKVVIPIVETVIMDRVSHDALVRLELKPPDIASCFESLLKGDDDLLKLEVLEVIKVLNDPRFDHLLHLASDDDHVRVSAYARKILVRE